MSVDWLVRWSVCLLVGHTLLCQHLRVIFAQLLLSKWLISRYRIRSESQFFSSPSKKQIRIDLSIFSVLMSKTTVVSINAAAFFSHFKQFWKFDFFSSFCSSNKNLLIQIIVLILGISSFCQNASLPWPNCTRHRHPCIPPCLLFLYFLETKTFPIDYWEARSSRSLLHRFWFLVVCEQWK